MNQLREFFGRTEHPQLNISATVLVGVGGAGLLASKVIAAFADHEPAWVIWLHLLGVGVVLSALVWLGRRLNRRPEEVVPLALFPCVLTLMVLYASTAQWFSVGAYAVMALGLLLQGIGERRSRRTVTAGAQG
ncbi:hypothetical protein [Corynebacterium halotolerans]|uniref:hypothetical protein n=1 Tax=Corynebacterium halotolerans TaxID=225326 RepID=UPI003CF19426